MKPLEHYKDGFWVFAYGSLLWNPGFEYEEAVRVRLKDHARRFCMWSICYRGTVANPGLVLALTEEQGGLCEGIAFKVSAKNALKTLEELRARELVTSAYLEREIHVTDQNDQDMAALTYVIDIAHDQYTGPLSLQKQASIIANAHGERGPNSEYLFNTVSYIEQAQMHDGDLFTLRDLVQEEVLNTK